MKKYYLIFVTHQHELFGILVASVFLKFQFFNNFFSFYEKYYQFYISSTFHWFFKIQYSMSVRHIFPFNIYQYIFLYFCKEHIQAPTHQFFALLHMLASTSVQEQKVVFGVFISFCVSFSQQYHTVNVRKLKIQKIIVLQLKNIQENKSETLR